MIDTHCHLDSPCFYEDIEEVIARAMERGVVRFVIPGADIKDLPRARELSEQFSEVYFAAGIHPYNIDGYDEKLLRDALVHPKCVAVGECGLDYYRLEGSEEARAQEKARQKACFLAQIKLAREFCKPLILHIREASNDSYEILKESALGLSGVLHCFNADSVLLELAEQGFYYGIGGVSTFKNARRLIEILPKIPKDKILLETDAPYLAPHPHRGTRNEPSYIPLIAARIAEVLGSTIPEIERLSDENAHRLFGKLA